MCGMHSLLRIRQLSKLCLQVCCVIISMRLSIVVCRTFLWHCAPMKWQFCIQTTWSETIAMRWILDESTWYVYSSYEHDIDDENELEEKRWIWCLCGVQLALDIIRGSNRTRNSVSEIVIPSLSREREKLNKIDCIRSNQRGKGTVFIFKYVYICARADIIPKREYTYTHTHTDTDTSSQVASRYDL